MDARIIGLRGCGKTTLLEALAEGHTGGGVASVKLHDSRLLKLAEIIQPGKTTFAEFQVHDVDWPRSEGRRSEMDRYFNSLQGANVCLHVIRAFDNPMLGAPPDPLRDLGELDSAFVLGDLVIIEAALERAKKQPLDEIKKQILVRCQEALEAETPLRDADLDANDLAAVKGYGFRTLIPQVVLVNTTEGAPFERTGCEAAAAPRDLVAFPFLEAREVAELSHDEQAEFARELGLPGPAAEIVTRAVFHQMGLITFFTVGPKEVRAWEVPRGATARQAAGAIHSDLERGFIRAETVSYDELVAHGSLKACRDAGVLRLEGKDYPVKDGDIITVRFNV